MTERISTQILVFDGVELLDFCAPHEVLTACRADEQARRESQSPFQIKLVSADGLDITTNGGVSFRADELIADSPVPDLLVVPGGIGTRRLRTEQRVLDWLTGLAGQGCTVTSVCTGAMLLGAAGLLNGRECTTHWMFTGQLATDCPQAKVVTDRRVVDSGSIVSAAGVTAGIDLALHLVARYVSREAALNTAAYIEYSPGGEYLFTPPA